MSGKSFKKEKNPALQFISSQAENKIQADNEISNDNQEQEINAEVPMKRNPLYIETKSKRVQLLMQPSLYSRLKEIAVQKGTSVNDLIHTVLEQSAKKSK